MSLTNFITIAAAQRLTGRDVAKVEIWAHVVFVCFTQGSPRFMSKKDFREDAVKERVELASKCKIFASTKWNHPSYYAVTEGDKTHYEVTLYNGALHCQCADYKSQWGSQPSDRICCHTIALHYHLNKPLSGFAKNIKSEEKKILAQGMSID